MESSANSQENHGLCGISCLISSLWCQIRNLRERLYEENQALRQREADNLILRRQLHELTTLLGRALEKESSSQESSRDIQLSPECLQQPIDHSFDGIPISSGLPLHGLLSPWHSPWPSQQAHSLMPTWKRTRCPAKRTSAFTVYACLRNSPDANINTLVLTSLQAFFIQEESPLDAGCS